jgi:hypothetical protein
MLEVGASLKGFTASASEILISKVLLFNLRNL